MASGKPGAVQTCLIDYFHSLAINDLVKMVKVPVSARGYAQLEACKPKRGRKARSTRPCPASTMISGSRCARWPGRFAIRI